MAPLTPEEDIAKNKDLAALSYIWILSLGVYFARKDSPFAQFHARQGVTLFILSLICMIVPVVSKLLLLLVLVGCVMGFMNAAQGKRVELPLVAALSRMDWKKLRADWQTVVNAIGRFWHSVTSAMPKSHHEEKKPTATSTSSAPTPAQPPAPQVSPQPAPPTTPAA